jgi:hypothetical protein
LALGYLIVLGGSYLQGHFLTDPQGRPIANDFVNVWAAARLALDGTAPDVAAYAAAIGASLGLRTGILFALGRNGQNCV